MRIPLASEVEIFRRGEEVILRKPDANLERAFDLLSELSEDFMVDGRHQAETQLRGEL